MAEICEHFELRENPKNNRRLEELKGMTISEAASKMQMTVTEFLEMLGQMEREGKIKIEIK
jgi:hypothetical protein